MAGDAASPSSTKPLPSSGMRSPRTTACASGSVRSPSGRSPPSTAWTSTSANSCSEPWSRKCESPAGRSTSDCVSHWMKAQATALRTTTLRLSPTTGANDSPGPVSSNDRLRSLGGHEGQVVEDPGQTRWIVEPLEVGRASLSQRTASAVGRVYGASTPMSRLLAARYAGCRSARPRPWPAGGPARRRPICRSAATPRPAPAAPHRPAVQTAAAAGAHSGRRRPGWRRRSWRRRRRPGTTPVACRRCASDRSGGRAGPRTGRAGPRSSAPRSPRPPRAASRACRRPGCRRRLPG
jgi:hypothetical protein